MLFPFVWKHPLRFALPLLAFVSALGAAEQFAGESAKWRRYQTPHFEMFSAARDMETREMLHKLEMLRSLFYDTMKLKERQPKEVTLYYFGSEKAFKAYSTATKKEIAGYYLDRPDRAVIVLSPAWDDEAARAIIFHEYIHHLNRAIGTEPPLWYNEGVAELFSTIEFERDGVVIGNPLGWHIASLRQNKMLPLEALFAVDHQSPIYNNGEHSGQFYAQSWVLMHYWQFGKNKLDRSKVEMFLTYATGGVQSTDRAFMRQLFQETMGMDYAGMQRELEHYFSSGYFFNRKAPLPKVAEASSYESRPLTPEEIRDCLADLALRAKESPIAKLALLDAVAANPMNVRVWEVLGADAWAQGDVDLARERWLKAIDAGSRNAAIHHELGQIAGHRWFDGFNYYLRLPSQTAGQLRTLFKRSIESAPEQFAAYEMLAWVEASVETPDIANVNLVQARFQTLRKKARTVVAFAMVRLHLGDPDGARKMLAQLKKLPPDHWSAVAAESILSKLENREPRQIEAPEGDEEARPQFRLSGPDLPGK